MYGGSLDLAAGAQLTGCSQGRVAAFYSSELQRHTAFRAHAAAEGPVRQLLFHDKGVVALGTKSVHMATRRGVPVWHLVYVAGPLTGWFWEGSVLMRGVGVTR